jgi:hypothetical protein
MIVNDELEEKGERKLSWQTSKYCTKICLEDMGKIMKTSVTIACQ